MCECTVTGYIESCETVRDKIIAIDLLIEKMMLAALDASGSAIYSSYDMNDGQMIVKAAYRNANDVFEGINVLEKIKQRYINQLDGRVMTFRGGNRITGFRC